MKKLTLLLGLCMIWTAGTFGQGSSYRIGTTIHINQEDTLRGNTLMAGQLLEMMGVANDDFFSASRQLILQGRVEDDAFVSGEVISVGGEIGDMLVAAGETVIIDGLVEGDLFVAGREVQIGDNAQIRGNVAVAGERIVFNQGSVGGWFRAAGNRIELNGRVNNIVDLYTNDVKFGDTYRAAYSTTVTSTEQLHRENLGTAPENLTLFVEEPNIWSIILVQLWLFLSLMLTGLILIRIFQQTATDMYRFATEHVLANTGIGVLALVGIPIAILVLIILFVTLPLAVLLALTYALALFISYLLVAMVLGVTGIGYFQKEPTQATYYWGLILGMVLVAILSNLPFIGWLVNLFFILFGLGSVLYYFWMMSRASNQSPGMTESKLE